MQHDELDEMYRHVAGDAWKWAKAIAIVESGENPAAVGDGGAAVGLMQMHSDFFTDWRQSPTCNRDYPICQVAAFVRFWNVHYLLSDERRLGIYNQGPRGVDEYPDKAAAYVARVGAAYDAIEG